MENIMLNELRHCQKDIPCFLLLMGHGCYRYARSFVNSWCASRNKIGEQWEEVKGDGNRGWEGILKYITHLHDNALYSLVQWKYKTCSKGNPLCFHSWHQQQWSKTDQCTKHKSHLQSLPTYELLTSALFLPFPERPLPCQPFTQMWPSFSSHSVFPLNTGTYLRHAHCPWGATVGYLEWGESDSSLGRLLYNSNSHKAMLPYSPEKTHKSRKNWAWDTNTVDRAPTDI